jgi:hypothetical protein
VLHPRVLTRLSWTNHSMLRSNWALWACRLKTLYRCYKPDYKQSANPVLPFVHRHKCRDHGHQFVRQCSPVIELKNSGRQPQLSSFLGELLDRKHSSGPFFAAFENLRELCLPLDGQSASLVRPNHLRHSFNLSSQFSGMPFPSSCFTPCIAAPHFSGAFRTRQ